MLVLYALYMYCTCTAFVAIKLHIKIATSDVVTVRVIFILQNFCPVTVSDIGKKNIIL